MSEYFRKAILVIGMHRSGTSAMIAGVKQALNVDLGSIQDCYFPENPKGFFENFDIVHLNNRILTETQGAWDALGFGKPIDFSDSSLDSCRQEAEKLIEKYYKNSQIWGLKDPRISVLLPFWDPLLKKSGSEIYRILALRSPFEVALSQQKRYRQYLNSSVDYLSGEDLRYSLNLWFWYNLRVLRDISDDNNIIVEFDHLINDPVGQMKRVGRFIEIEPNPEGLKVYAESFLEKNLKHHNIHDTRTCPHLTEYKHIFDLYHRMKQYALKSRLSREDARKLLEGLPDDQILQSWSAPIFSHIDSIKRKMLGIQMESQAFLKQKTDIEKQWSVSVSRVLQLQEAMTYCEQTIAEKDRILIQKDQALTETVSSLAGLRHQVSELEETIYQKNRLWHEAASSVSTFRQKVADMKADCAQKEQLLSEKNALIAAKDGTIGMYRDELYSVYVSRSWRYALLFRKIGSVIRRLQRWMYRPRIRKLIKTIYFLLPARLRCSRMTERLKSSFKSKETIIYPDE